MISARLTFPHPLYFFISFMQVINLAGCSLQREGQAICKIIQIHCLMVVNSDGYYERNAGLTGCSKQNYKSRIRNFPLVTDAADSTYSSHNGASRDV